MTPNDVIAGLGRAAAGPLTLVRRFGRVRKIVGQTVYVSGCEAHIGQVCRIDAAPSTVLAEVVGFDDGTSILVPYGDIGGVSPGARVEHAGALGKPAPDDLLGRVVDALGQPLDGAPLTLSPARRSQPPHRINPLDRLPIVSTLDVGVRSINALLTVGRGQRVGLFAGSGVGKSVLLGMMARMTAADVVVVALIGERGREVREFIEHNLAGGLDRAVVIASPADDNASLRLRAAFFATEVAEAYRHSGKNVLMIMDSLTRVAQAQRELSLAAGEPPTSKGYTPSVYGLLPRLVERAGNFEAEAGSVTAFYTVLTEEDDLQDPVADAARAVLDGHVVLSRRLADQGLFPAIDVSASLSRVMPNVVSAAHLEQARRFRELWSAYRDQEDLITVGAYTPGSDVRVDAAIAMRPRLEAFVRQGAAEPETLDASVQKLTQLFATTEEHHDITT